LRLSSHDPIAFYAPTCGNSPVLRPTFPWEIAGPAFAHEAEIPA